jgi:hypothetical protein
MDMRKIEIFLNDNILKELQHVATVKGISLEEAANKVLEVYAKRYANMENSTTLAIKRAMKRYN